jgi:hypothetical protein
MSTEAESKDVDMVTPQRPNGRKVSKHTDDIVDVIADVAIGRML